jgi:hypothetical protein
LLELERLRVVDLADDPVLDFFVVFGLAAGFLAVLRVRLEAGRASTTPSASW